MLFGLVLVRVRGGGPESGSRWSAHSAARTNDLEAGEDPPHTPIGQNEAKDVVVQVICGLPGANVVWETTLRVPAPSLIWVHGLSPAT